MPSTATRFAIKFAGIAWRLVVYFAVLIAAFWVLSSGYGWVTHALRVQFAHSPGTRPAEAVGLGQARLLIAAIVASLVSGKFGRDPIARMLPLRSNSGSRLVQGIFWGFAAIAATMGAIAAFDGYRVSRVVLSGPATAYYVPLWAAISVVNGLAENLALLGYPLFTIAKAAGWRTAVPVAALLFAAAHLGNPGENPMGIASVFLIALVMAATIWLTGDLWLSVGIHSGIIIAEDLVFSVPDSGVTYTGHLLASSVTGPAWLSGGDAGPEGSALAFPIFAILLALLWIIYDRRPDHADD